YDAAAATLRIVFVSGAVYDYKKVPAAIYQDLKTASSKGVHLNTHIKGNYAFKKIKYPICKRKAALIEEIDTQCAFQFSFYRRKTCWHEYFYRVKKNIMKSKQILVAAATILLFACNNQSSGDSVDKADSINAAKSDSSTVRTDSSGTVQPTIKADETTTDFLVKAANGGMAEVKLAELAKDKSGNSAIKEFAGMMITDHGAANEKVKKLAADRNVTLPAEPGADEQKKAADLSKKTGADFDKAYADAMVKGHKDVLDMFKNASAKVTDADVKSFIDNTIPVIEHHLQRIQDIKKSLK
ncbi:MAG: DUF4142 domain-containing protein, partial [Bacteroidota bacterium]